MVVPSLLNGMLDLCPESRRAIEDLRYCFTSGETLSAPLAARFRAKLPNCRLINLYGSSEVAADVTCYEVAAAADGAAISIGRPIHNSQIYLLDGNLQPVPIGVRGELYIGGDNLARGYLHRDELTAERFIANPFDPKRSRYLFRSGDLARYRTDGNLEFLGRADDQVKIRGCRIELGEVEAALARHQDIRQCFVAVSEAAPPDTSEIRPEDKARSLVAYVVPVNLPPPASALRAFLRRQLPDFMIPSTFFRLDALPLLPNGKIDRRALPIAPPGTGAGDHRTFEPRTEMEALVAQIWREVLNLPKIEVDDNFFELGGHSLLAARIVAQLRATLERPVSLHTIFEGLTISGMAKTHRKFHAKRSGRKVAVDRTFAA